MNEHLFSLCWDVCFELKLIILRYYVKVILYVCVGVCVRACVRACGVCVCVCVFTERLCCGTTSRTPCWGEHSHVRPLCDLKNKLHRWYQHHFIHTQQQRSVWYTLSSDINEFQHCSGPPGLPALTLASVQSCKLSLRWIQHSRPALSPHWLTPALFGRTSMC